MVTDSVFVEKDKGEFYWMIFAVDDENYRYCFTLVPGPECPVIISSFKKLFKNSAYSWPEKYKQWVKLDSIRCFRVMCALLLEAIQSYWERPNVRRPVKVMIVCIFLYTNVLYSNSLLRLI